MMLPSTDGGFLVGPLLPPVARLGIFWVSGMFSESSATDGSLTSGPRM